jgi:hypothetical protein
MYTSQSFPSCIINFSMTDIIKTYYLIAMKFHHSVMLLMTLLMLVLHVSCDPGHPYRRLPFNGSMYGKRAASILPSSKLFKILCFTHLFTIGDQSKHLMGR